MIRKLSHIKKILSFNIRINAVQPLFPEDCRKRFFCLITAITITIKWNKGNEFINRFLPLIIGYNVDVCELLSFIQSPLEPLECENGNMVRVLRNRNYSSFRLVWVHPLFFVGPVFYIYVSIFLNPLCFFQDLFQLLG